MALLPLRRGGSVTRPGSQTTGAAGAVPQAREAVPAGSAGSGHGFRAAAGPAGWYREHSSELTETGDAYIAEIELPGLSGDDVSVELAGQELVITGRFAGAAGAGRGASRAATRAGVFEYRVLLPGPAEPASVTAWLAGGVLTVTAPKAGST
jgi:HSP20 family molecular chaperone IbpA